MMWFFVWPFLLVPFVLWALGREGRLAGCGMHAGHAMPGDPTRPDPVEIVRQRLARGEITPEQYDEIRRALG